MRRIGVAAVVGAFLLALGAMSSSAGAYSVQYCSPITIIVGTPPWGFNTGAPITGATGSYARGHGDVSLSNYSVSGILCQVDRPRNGPDRLIVMTVSVHHLLYYSHVGMMWGYPGNLMKVRVRVKSSTDPRCRVGTTGTVTVFGSYNGVRSDSVQFAFARGCKTHNHLYHGSQVNVQVPPA